MAVEISFAAAKPSNNEGMARVNRARSVPDRQPFVRAVILSSIHYLGLVSTATALVIFFINPTPLGTKFLVGSMVFSIFTWIIAFIKRRHTHCPLCKGTPLIDSGAHAHKKAVKLFPLNYGTTATLSIIAKQQFNCMYCGSPFDLLKEPSHRRPYSDYNEVTNYTSDDES